MRSIKRFRVAFIGAVLTAAAIAVTVAMPGSAAPPTANSIDNPIKINVMGEWAHPDDDTSIIGPCGVWHQRYGVRCGIIMVTRGEGGGNAVGTEIGPALGLRRENEDRVAHYRSGTVDIFNLDKVDFFYNQSAPLTQFFWGHDDTLRRVTRIIRMTQPDIYIGFTPTLGAGHGNHQQAGRFIWEGMHAAAEPDDVPRPADRAARAQHVAGQEDLLRRRTAGTGGTTHRRRLHHRLHPDAGTNLDNVAGVWTGYDSPYLWPRRQRPGPARRLAEDLGAGRRPRARRAYPTQSRVMYMGTAAAGCSRFGMTGRLRAVPAEREPGRLGEPARRQGRRDPLRRGRRRIRAGCPLGHARVPDLRPLLQRAGHAVPGDAAPEGRRGRDPRRHGGADRAGGLDGRRGAKPIGAVSSAAESTVTFNVTPAVGAAVNTNFKISRARRPAARPPATRTRSCASCSPVEGRFQRWGNWAEYDQLARDRRAAGAAGSAARRRSRRPAVGETFTLPVVVHNWSDDAAERHRALTLPAGVTRRRDVEAVRAARARRRHDGQLHRLEHVHERDAADHRARRRARRTRTSTSASRRPTAPAARASRT